jgi:hypothetical protein
MTEWLLVPGDEHPLAKAIREAIGAGDFDEVAVTLPQFHRADGKVVTYIPTTIKEYTALRNAPEWILRDVGMQPWDEKLWLFPAEWYDHIPEGFVVVDIAGKRKEFKRGVTDGDRRFGALAYGLEKTP